MSMYFFLRRVVNGVLMHSPSLMEELASDLGWWHAGETHEAHRHKRVQRSWIDTVKLDIALGLIMNIRTAKYLTPRLSVYAANVHKHQREHRQAGTHVHQRHTDSSV